MLSSDSAQERMIFKTKETGNQEARSVILLTHGQGLGQKRNEKIYTTRKQPNQFESGLWNTIKNPFFCCQHTQVQIASSEPHVFPRPNARSNATENPMAICTFLCTFDPICPNCLLLIHISPLQYALIMCVSCSFMGFILD